MDSEKFINEIFKHAFEVEFKDKTLGHAVSIDDIMNIAERYIPKCLTCSIRLKSEITNN